MSTPNPYEDGAEDNAAGANAVTRYGTDNSAWIPDEALAALVTERDLHQGESEEELSRRLMIENVAGVTMSIINLAMHGSTERTRLDAGKYVIERVLGRVGDDAFGGAKSPAEMLIESVTDYVHMNDGVGTDDAS